MATPTVRIAQSPAAVNSLPCPICHSLHVPKPKRTATGWHDVFVCCQRVFDTCCQREFERIDWHAVPVAQLIAQVTA